MRAGPNSLAGKWFAEQYDDAVAWGEYGKAQGSGDFVIIEAVIPDVLLAPLYYVEALDGIGPAWYVDGLDMDHITWNRSERGEP